MRKSLTNWLVIVPMPLYASIYFDKGAIWGKILQNCVGSIEEVYKRDEIRYFRSAI